MKPIVKHNFKSISIFFLVMGVIALAAGIYLLFFRGSGYAETPGVIDHIEDHEIAADEIEHRVYVRYTVGGHDYVSLFDEYQPGFVPGKAVTVRYDPADPSRIVSGSKVLPVILIAVGGLIVLAEIFIFVKGHREKQARKDMEPQPLFTASGSGEERKLYFLADLGTMKETCRIEDASRRVLYEIRCRKFSPLADSQYEFIDHEAGRSTLRYVGKTVTTTSSAIWAIDNHSTYALDGRDIWKILHENGITIRTGMSGLYFTYTLYRNDREIGKAVSTGRYPHEEDAAEHPAASKVPARGFYRITTTETNCEVLFLALFSIMRTDMAIYN